MCERRLPVESVGNRTAGRTCKGWGQGDNMRNCATTLIARAVCVTFVTAAALAARAQDAPDSLEVTIRLLPENAVGPEEITRRIELPPAAANATPPRAS